jgi:FkbM family methyltransferase
MLSNPPAEELSAGVREECCALLDIMFCSLIEDAGPISSSGKPHLTRLISMPSLTEKIKSKLTAIRQTWHFANRWELLINQALFGNRLAVYRFGDIELLIDQRTGDHNGGARSAFGSDEYTQFLRTMRLPASSRVLDLGAHVGSFTLLLHAWGVSLAQVVCLEPNPRTFPKLEFNLRRNLGCPLTLLCAAVADCPGRLPLWQSGPSVGSSLQPPISEQAGKTLVGQTNVLTFDGIYEHYFAPEGIDICKMDIEGSEYALLASGSAARLDRCRYLFIEIHPPPVGSQSSEIDLLRSIQARGFRELPTVGSAFIHTRCFENERLAASSSAKDSHGH